MKKSAFFYSLALLAFALTAALAQSQTTGKFQVNGVDASATVCLNQCQGGFGSVELASSGNGPNATWFVYFTIYGFDSQGNQTSIGSAGQIPTSMVSGNGQTSLSVNLDTNAAGLDVQYCVYDSFENATCTPYAGGIMNVTWTPTKTYTFHGNVEDQGTSSAFTLDYHVNGDGSSAVATANLFGQQYTDAGESQIGTDHVGQISFTQQ